ncbi:hypothetical protein K1719_046378 [Acacia pycnantha]|nr:hypothetical protein K1719_046378 [Acacia pycnantha]
MLHPVPFEGNLKDAPPPHPGEDQSAKRAKLGEDLNLDDSMEADQSSDVGSLVSHVPETQMSLEPSPPQDTPMGDDIAAAAEPKVPSFKDKLLNTDSNPMLEDDEDIVLEQGDVSIGLNGMIPTVDFATHVLDTLNKKMGLTVVVKLLGRKIGYRYLRSQLQSLWKPSGQLKLIDLHDDCFLVRFQDDLDYQNALLTGPWMIFGHYLTVQPWTPSFRSQDHTVNQVIGWIRLPKLPARYYHKSIIRSIGGVFGDVIKVDYNTDSGERGKFARIAVVIDLTKPLISKIMVDGEIIFVEYEGLPVICYNCGKYGHLQNACPASLATAPGAQSEMASTAVPNAPSPDQLARESSHFGSWMQVQRRRRPPVRGDKASVTLGSKSAVNGSRYEVLGEVTAEDENQAPEPSQNNRCPNDESVTRRVKVKETKGLRKSDPGIKHKVASVQGTNHDNIFTSQHYVAKRSETSLDHNFNSVVRIEDPRFPRTNQATRGSKGGPPTPVSSKARPNSGNDPCSKARGTKISSGVTIHHLGAKPNPDDAGPSIKVMKNLAQGLHNEMNATDDTQQEEGAIIIPALF